MAAVQQHCGTMRATHRGGGVAPTAPMLAQVMSGTLKSPVTTRAAATSSRAVIVAAKARASSGGQYQTAMSREGVVLSSSTSISASAGSSARRRSGWNALLTKQATPPPTRSALSRRSSVWDVGGQRRLQLALAGHGKCPARARVNRQINARGEIHSVLGDPSYG